MGQGCLVVGAHVRCQQMVSLVVGAEVVARLAVPFDASAVGVSLGVAVHKIDLAPELDPKDVGEGPPAGGDVAVPVAVVSDGLLVGEELGGVSKHRAIGDGEWRALVVRGIVPLRVADRRKFSVVVQDQMHVDAPARGLG